MTRAARIAPILLCVPALLALALAAPADEKGDAKAGDVTLVPVKWEEFQSRLAKPPRGAKYTLVDAWATNCGPCKENFPHLVEMHRKFGPKGLAVASLSLDDISDKGAVAEARQFLKEKDAQFANYLMNEEFGVGFEKLNINAIPAVFLYGPDGKEVMRFTLDDAENQFTYDEVEAYVAKLLGGKK